MMRPDVKYIQYLTTIYLQIYLDANRLLVIGNVVKIVFKFATHLIYFEINEMPKFVHMGSCHNLIRVYL